MNAEQADNIVALIFGDQECSAKAVDHIFSTLRSAYGIAFDRSLGGTPIEESKSMWGYQISGFTHSKTAKRAIVWALDNLPPKAPNAIEFKLLCRQAPAAEVPQLPAPKVNPEIAARVLGELREQQTASVYHFDHKGWAKRIMRDVEAGIKRSSISVRFAKEALGVSA